MIQSAIPANRVGQGIDSAAEIKTLQDDIAPIIFAGLAVLRFKAGLTANHLAGFGPMAAGASFIFKGPIAV